MKLAQYHLTYCTNIHPGERWSEVQQSLQTYLPPIRNALAPDQPFGIGLRLSYQATEDILAGNKLEEFQAWLTQNNYYVFTMNAFPYGGFHHQRVKDAVHHPDWTTPERLHYTLRSFEVLAKLLPQGMEGGISTSPLSYKLWYRDETTLDSVRDQATHHLAQVAEYLYRQHQSTGQLLHLDLEPEPDGLLETTQEVIDYFSNWLLPQGIPYLQQQLGVSPDEAERGLRTHIRICYDVCHFAVGYERPRDVFDRWQQSGIKVGKIQLSAALRAQLPAAITERTAVRQAFASLVESTYLHQVIARSADEELIRYNDLPNALEHIAEPHVREWRTHFHVPIFVAEYGALAATQSDIEEVLAILREEELTQHLEVETYTWEVLPPEIRLGLAESITRELQWVQDHYQA
jgi:hypothetical protein